ncbi:MAG: hypothetical protein V4631_03295 [Pseudomonadota bacterium]
MAINPLLTPRRARAALLSLLLAAPAALAQPAITVPTGGFTPPPLTAEMAFSTRWQSRVRLGQDMSAISSAPFTISARFFRSTGCPTSAP